MKKIPRIEVGQVVPNTYIFEGMNVMHIHVPNKKMDVIDNSTFFSAINMQQFDYFFSIFLCLELIVT